MVNPFHFLLHLSFPGRGLKGPITLATIILKHYKGISDIRQARRKSENEENQGSGLRAPQQSVWGDN